MPELRGGYHVNQILGKDWRISRRDVERACVDLRLCVLGLRVCCSWLLLHHPELLAGIYLLEGVAILILMGGVILLVLTAWVVQKLSTPLLRLFEGYWPWPFIGLRFWLSRKVGEVTQRSGLSWKTWPTDMMRK